MVTSEDPTRNSDRDHKPFNARKRNHKLKDADTVRNQKYCSMFVERVYVVSYVIKKSGLK